MTSLNQPRYLTSRHLRANRITSSHHLATNHLTSYLTFYLSTSHHHHQWTTETQPASASTPRQNGWRVEGWCTQKIRRGHRTGWWPCAHSASNFFLWLMGVLWFFLLILPPPAPRELLVCIFWLATCLWNVCWIARGGPQNGDFFWRFLTTGFAAIGANKWFPIEFRNLRIFKAMVSCPSTCWGSFPGLGCDLNRLALWTWGRRQLGSTPRLSAPRCRGTAQRPQLQPQRSPGWGRVTRKKYEKKRHFTWQGYPLERDRVFQFFCRTKRGSSCRPFSWNTSLQDEYQWLKVGSGRSREQILID